MKNVAMNLSIPEDVRDDLRSAVPEGQRSTFVANAIANALRERSRTKALALLDDLPLQDIGGENAVEVLKELRQDRMGKMADRHSPLAQ